MAADLAYAVPPEGVVLEVQELRAGYGGRVVLEGVSFQVAAGERVAVVGPNGAGKTTLFKCIAGLLRPWSGSILLGQGQPGGGQGRAGGGRARALVAYVPQKESVNWHFPATVYDVVMMARLPSLGLWRPPGLRDRQAVLEALEQVGMAGMAGRPIQELSGGQQQRVFLARALAQRAPLVLLDEPFHGVEPAAQNGVVEALSRLRDQGAALLMSTHDLDFVEQSGWFDRVLVLRGRLLADGPPRAVRAAGRGEGHG